MDRFSGNSMPRKEGRLKYEWETRVREAGDWLVLFSVCVLLDFVRFCVCI